MRGFSWTFVVLLVALVFIGVGVGMIFERVDAGGALGFGAGLLAVAYLSLKRETRVDGALLVGPMVAAAVLAVTGCLFIVVGVGIVLGLGAYWRVISGLFVVALGLVFLSLALKVARM